MNQRRLLQRLRPQLRRLLQPPRQLHQRQAHQRQIGRILSLIMSPEFQVLQPQHLNR